MTRFILPASVALAIAGCAETRTGVYPSLLPRATEMHGFAEPAPVAVAPAAADPTLDARIAELAATIARKQAAFATAAAVATRRVAAARHAAEGGEAWLDAQTALGDLDVLRADASEPLATLEQFALDRAVDLAPLYPGLDAALAAARSVVTDMSDRIATLQTGLAHQAVVTM